jgi:spermidine synthase
VRLNDARPGAAAPGRALLLTTLVCGLSGFCGLAYQVVWQRTVAWDFGGDSVASAVVSGTFLLGLGLGAWLFGHARGDAGRSYALLEIAIGVFGAVSFHLISPLAGLLAQAMRAGPEEAEGLRSAVVVGAILLLLPPATLIGGTLPLMLRRFVATLGFSARSIGWLYGSNTLGAGLGILAAPVLLLNQLSLPATLALVAVINGVVGVVMLAWRSAPAQTPTATPGAGGAVPWLALLLSFASGFFALSFEVSLFRAFRIVNPSSAYNFPVVLGWFLVALAAGSFLLTRRLGDGPEAILARVGGLLVAAAVALPASVSAAMLLRMGGTSGSFLRIVDGYGLAELPGFLAFTTMLVAPVPFLTGAIVPLLLRLQSVDEDALPVAAGRVGLASALGSFAGALLGDFVLIPAWGSRAFLTLVGLAVGGAGVVLLAWIGWRRGSGLGRAAVLALLVVAAPLAAPAPVWHTYVTGDPQPGPGVLEGATGVAHVRWQGATADVRVNGQYMSRLPHHPRHVRQEAFLLSAPRRARVLVLGLGGGGIVRSLADDPGVRHVHVVEWSRELPRVLADAEPAASHLDSPKVTLVQGDARIVVGLFEGESFDVVFDNLAFLAYAGGSSVNSETYFRGIRRVLAPDGIFVKGANYYQGPDRLAVLAGLVNTFAVVEEHPVAEVVVASSRPVAWDDARVQEVMASRADVTSGRGSGPADQLRWFRGGFSTIDRTQLGGAAPVRDELLTHEYYWRPWEE